MRKNPKEGSNYKFSAPKRKKGGKLREEEGKKGKQFLHLIIQINSQ